MFFSLLLLLVSLVKIICAGSSLSQYVDLGLIGLGWDHQPHAESSTT
jgi:hypothetical protein